jgi:hypothetical protein
MWRLWCKALGEKASVNKREADLIALIRTLIFISYFVTNGFIIANAIRHWNNVPPPQQTSWKGGRVVEGSSLEN